jgi:hypothetical protein
MKTLNQTQETQYSEMFQKAKDGTISQEIWFEYCSKILDQKLEDNKNVLQRLKAR